MTHWGTYCHGAGLVEAQKPAHFAASLSKELHSKLGRTDRDFGALDFEALVTLARCTPCHHSWREANSRPPAKEVAAGVDCNYRSAVTFGLQDSYNDFPPRIRDPLHILAPCARKECGPVGRGGLVQLCCVILRGLGPNSIHHRAPLRRRRHGGRSSHSGSRGLCATRRARVRQSSGPTLSAARVHG